MAIARAQRVTAQGDEVLVAGEAAPLLVRGLRSGRPFAYLAFALEESNLAVQLAFPVLGDRLISELAGAALPPADLRVGQLLPPGAGGGEMTVQRPGGGRFTVGAGAPPPVADRPGFWALGEVGRPDRAVAVNAD
ncbi:MAG: hypothetical protein ACRD0F_10020, partial [Acidimicrobiales bacterium]